MGNDAVTPLRGRVAFYGSGDEAVPYVYVCKHCGVLYFTQGA